MFSFLNSTVLLAAAAALIPLIIHLFSRRKVKVVEFSSLKHLKAMQRRQVRKLKIRQLLLLLMRMLIILLVVMAFARPTTEGGTVGSHASVSAVVIFDNSASMNRYTADGNLYDLARQRVEHLLETFGESDRICLLPVVKTADPVEAKFTSAATAKAILSGSNVSAQAADLGPALETACALLNNDENLNKEIYLVSDRQTGLLPDSSYLRNCTAQVYILDLPLESSANVGITNLDFGGQLIIPGHNFELTATVRNHSSDDIDNLIASLFINDNRVAQVDFSVESGKDALVRFERSVNRTGFHSGYVEISDDHYMVDNRFYFSFRIPERFNLLIIGDDPASQLVELAMAPSSDINQFWSIKRVSPANLAGINFFDYDIIYLPQTVRLAETFIKRIDGFVLSGKALWIGYGEQTDVTQFNERWSRMTGVTIDDPMKTAVSRAGYYSFQSFESAHPIFSVFGLNQGKLPEVRFYTLPTVTVDPSARVLMKFSGNRPALVEETYGKGRVLTFTGPMSPEFTDLTSHAFFVPFVSRIAEYLSSDLSTFDLVLRTDENIVRAISVNGSIDAALDVIKPDSSSYQVVPTERNGSLVVNPKPTDQAGIYSVRYLGREIDLFAVNTDPDEGNLERVTADDLAAAVGANEFREIEYDGEIAEIVTEARYGREMWQLFLWLATIVIAIELILSRSRPVEE